MAGYSGTPLATKLGIKPGHEVALFRPPPDFEKTLGELPENVHVQVGLAGKTPLDVAISVYGPDADLVNRIRARMAKARSPRYSRPSREKQGNGGNGE